MTNPMLVVLLCGGRGTRLGKLTLTCQKCLLPVGGRPFMDCVIERFASFGFRQFLLLAGYRGEQVHEAYAEWGKFRGLDTQVRVGPPQGTLVALRDAFAAGAIKGTFILANGDTYPLFDVRLAAPPSAGITVAKCRSVDSGVRKFDAALPLAFEQWTAAQNVEDLIAEVARAGRVLEVSRDDGDFIDIGTHENYQRATTIFR